MGIFLSFASFLSYDFHVVRLPKVQKMAVVLMAITVLEKNYPSIADNYFLTTPTSNFQPIKLLDLDHCNKFINLMANSADPDQLASSEGN